MPKKIIIDGINLIGVYKVGEFYKNGKKSIWETIKFTLSLIRYLAIEEYDLIECEQFPILPIFVCKLFSLIRGTPFVVTWHEVWGKDLWTSYIGSLGLIGALLEKISVYLPKKIISVSLHTTLKLVNAYKVNPVKIITIPNGIDLSWDQRKRNQKNDAPYISNTLIGLLEKRTPIESSDIIYVGRLLNHKNIDNLIQAIGILKKSNNSIKCIIIGDGPERDFLEELVSSLEVKENIIFKGFIDNEKRVYDYIKSSRVFVLPSTREGFGISVLEANACGLPVIVINHTDNAARELIRNGLNGYRCNLEPAEIAQEILHILEGPRDKYSAACKKVARKYAWAEIGMSVDSVYRSILEELTDEANVISVIK